MYHRTLPPEVDELCQQLLTEADFFPTPASWSRAYIVVSRVLKLKTGYISESLGVDPRTVNRWSSGVSCIPNTRVRVIGFLWKELDKDRVVQKKDREAMKAAKALKEAQAQAGASQK